MTTETTAPVEKAVDKAAAEARSTVTPAVDIFETASDVVIIADVPGVAADGIVLEAKDDTVSLRASRVDSAVDYARSFRMPAGVDVDGITAALKDGVLTVTVPKPAAMKPRVIAVH